MIRSIAAVESSALTANNHAGAAGGTRPIVVTTTRTRRVSVVYSGSKKKGTTMRGRRSLSSGRRRLACSASSSDDMKSTVGSRYAPLTPDGVLPPPIYSNEPGTWAYDTVSRRLRENILSRVFSDNENLLGDHNPEADAALKALDAELSDAGTSVLREITDDGGPDVDSWRELTAPWVGRTWLDTPWLTSEFYFYRRILEVSGERPFAIVDHSSPRLEYY